MGSLPEMKYGKMCQFEYRKKKKTLCDDSDYSNKREKTILYEYKTYLLGCGVQPITVLHGIVKITSLLVSSTSTIVSAAMASKHST